MKKIFFLTLIFNFAKPFDAIIIGGGGYDRGIGGIGLNYLSCFDQDIDNLNIGYITLEEFEKNINLAKIKIAQKDAQAKVKFFTYLLAIKDGEQIIDFTDKIISNSSINCAVSMLESDSIPSFWVDILNNKFDLVIVPDQWLIEIYQNCGVNIPIFVLDLVVDYNGLKKHKQKNKNFTFGMVSGLLEDKNIDKVIQAFNTIFKNAKNINLKIKISGNKKFNPILWDNIHKLANQAQNISLITKHLDRTEYCEFLNSLDCYILPSRGEGFSITTREALYREIPCIISKHTALKCFCDCHAAIGLNPSNLTRANYTCFGNFDSYKIDVKTRDIAKEMKNVVHNYEKLKAKTVLAKNICENAKKNNIYPKLKNLFSGNIVLADKNTISDTCVTTDSVQLYTKFKDKNE